MRSTLGQQDNPLPTVQLLIILDLKQLFRLYGVVCLPRADLIN